MLVLILLTIAHPNLWAMTLSAENLSYLSREGKYELQGNVVIEGNDTLIKADRAVVYEASLDVIAEGNVYYEDREALINAERAEINLRTKTGEIYRAVILFKEGNYWVVSEALRKIGDDRYYAASARFTTCNPNVPDLKGYTYQSAKTERFDWCFHGREVDLEIGRVINARDVSFRVKGLPLGYSPKVWAPISGQRSSGFLIPMVGTSSQKGIRFAPAFFWAIDEDKDMTFRFDYYSKRGLGKYAQVRYVEPKGKGEFNVYYLRDRVSDHRQLQVNVKQEHRSGTFKEFLDINYAKSIDMFKDYSFGTLERTQRFLQSSGEVALEFNHSRLYLLGQHWIDLKQKDNLIPQRLPELGFVLYPMGLGPFVFEMESSLSNFYSEKGTRAQRLDIMPTLSHTFGDGLQIYQSLSLRETAYSIQNSPDGKSTKHRETIRYDIQGKGRFVRHYEGLEHIIEPSLEYSFIPSRVHLPIFDSTEVFNDLSEARIVLLNLMRMKGSLIGVRLTQPYSLKDLHGKDRFAPTVFQASYISKPFIVRFEGSYDLNVGQLQTLYTDLSLALSNSVNLSFGERYSRVDNIHQYRGSINTTLSKLWATGINLWYDAKGGGLRDSSLSLKYTEQCWGTTLLLTRRPRYNEQTADYSLMFLVELKGLGTVGRK